jgi:hypothetical protein
LDNWKFQFISGTTVTFSSLRGATLPSSMCWDKVGPAAVSRRRQKRAEEVMGSIIDIGLNTVEDYWTEVIVPDVKAFQGTPSRGALFNAAGAIWHLHDWVWHERNPGVETLYNSAFRSYRKGLVDACPELGWLGDVTDASRHRGLGRTTEVKGSLRRTEGAFRGLLALTEPVLKFYLTLGDGSQQDADQVLRIAVEYWRTVELRDRNLPSP